MADPAKLIELAERVEALTVDNDPRLWMIRAYEAIFGSSPDHRWAPFEKLINARAFFNAAMTLVPEGMTWCVGTMDGTPEAGVWGKGPVPADAYVKAADPALALTAACLRAMAGRV
jgi:hypothetical protein